ncbi:nucleoside/nucleotide kinase family protein [Actinokineospora fastidiosa]|uniref:Nucleoside/nucleotide kinase family protein n=1 Tax=Actinokineospora fastidiosa TaxID=1816 RepID=A0A918G5H6_9PSEU|nr:nucleoside/nucleotide kinase family protein [Actinokineospora fastidiosa]GGS20419.1 nucleoside/nucleotide kinase family protein [Actinokineospora fastidiosa]
MGPTFPDLVARASALTDRRRLLGVCGPPGAGKSTLAARLAEALGERAALVGMDGFHLAQRVLDRLGAAEVKGAPHTFDADGYADLLARLKARTDKIVYAPEFRREIEEPVACAVPVPRDVPLVITEGNYLLHWPRVRALLDEVWYVDVPDDVRRERLWRRHMAYGRTSLEAWERTMGSDERNAVLIAAGREHADLVVTP